MSMNASQRYNLKVAVELNNIGVHLIQAQDYRNAMKILKQSVDALKIVIRSNEHADEFSTPPSLLEVDTGYTNIMNARRLMFEAYENTGMMVTDESDYYVYTKDYGFKYEKSVSTEAAISPSGACPILIEDVPYADIYRKLEVGDVVIESSILFYNLALVHIHVSESLDAQNKSSHHRRQPQQEQQEQRYHHQEEILIGGAMVLFDLSLNLILEDDGEEGEEDNEVVNASRVFMASLIFTEFIRLHHDRGEYEEAENYIQKLHELTVLYNISPEEYSESEPNAVVAAAA